MTSFWLGDNVCLQVRKSFATEMKGDSDTSLSVMAGPSGAKGKAAHTTGKKEIKERMLIPITSVQEVIVLIQKQRWSSPCYCGSNTYGSSLPLGFIVATASNHTNNISIHYCSKLFHLHIWKWLCVHLLSQEAPLPPWLPIIFSIGDGC